MSQDPLIDQLASGLAKSPRRPSLLWQVLIMLLMSAGASLILIGFSGLRSDWTAALHRPLFGIELLALMGLSVVAYIFAERSAVPGRIRGKIIPLASLGLFAAAIVSLYAQHVSEGVPSDFWKGAHCLLLITIGGSMPMFFALRLIRRGASTMPRLSMAFALFGSFGAAAAMQQVICADNDPWHLISWHLGILPLSGLIAWCLGRRVLRW